MATDELTQRDYQQAKRVATNMQAQLASFMANAGQKFTGGNRDRLRKITTLLEAFLSDVEDHLS